MNPVIIIPTYWCATGYKVPEEDLFAAYDHMTPINDNGELGRCLRSLHEVFGICRIVVTVVSEGLPSGKAEEKVKQIVGEFTDLDIIVIGDAEIEKIHKRLDELDMSEYREAVQLSGYGSIRNVGLLVAAILGHTEVIFIDDDEVIVDPDFLKRGLYGLGKVTKRGIPILAKTGFYLDRTGSYEAAEKDPWYDVAMKQDEAFNKWINRAMSGPRLVPSNSCYGGCIAIQAEAFKRVSFDPWITRGEDLDFMINMRMYGFDVWFDNTWSLRHMPPNKTSESLRFRQNIFRWIYEHRKLEYLRSQIDLIQVRPSDLEPYPGPFVDSNITRRLYITALLRSLARPEKQRYLKVAHQTHREAEDYAQCYCSRYFRFQSIWPELVGALENDEEMNTVLSGGKEHAHTGMTADFDRISSTAVWEAETAEPEPDDTTTAEEIAKRWASGNTSARTAARRAAAQSGKKGRSSVSAVFSRNRSGKTDDGDKPGTSGEGGKTER